MLAATGLSLAQSSDEAKVEFFEKKIRPLLVDNCYTCHSADTNAKGGLRVDDRNGLISGGGRGAAIVPGDPSKSLLHTAVKQTDKLKMPPEKKLTDEQIADLAQWIKDGAAWPKLRIPTSLGKPNPRYDKLRQEHWAWQPLSKPNVPTVADAKWAWSDVDRFLLAKLEGQGLKPVGDADKLTLLRRITFDLTGLPPTLAEIDTFLKDTSPKAFEKVVDRLLASSAFGERWGRHWLDVARYGESTGSARNIPYPHAWRYRDYVIDSFNADKPYDRFVREQLAGDLLESKSQQERDQQIVATGFLALGVKDVNQRFKVRFIMDNIDEQIDAVTRSFLGLTVSCARCHDHKFDPIPTTDYYALAGIFHSTDLCAGVRNKMGGGGLDYFDKSMMLAVGSAKKSEPDAKTAAKIEELKGNLEKAKLDWDKIRGTPEGLEKGADGFPKQRAVRLKMEKLQADLQALTDGSPDNVALGVRDAKAIGDTEVRIRGEAEKLGPTVPRGYLTLVSIKDAAKIPGDKSGRLELAQWMTSEHNPLTPRVYVNRIWHHLFAQGIVSSVDNFGTTGDTPSHPELLDHLANQFVRDGWSVKKLIRSLVLTHAYQLDSGTNEKALTSDPANRLVWRHSPRRLEAEEIRDTMLSVAGLLDLNPAVASPAKELKVVEIRNNGPEARTLQTFALASRKRSVYLPLVRGIVPGTLEVFDFAEQGMVTGSRDATTVAPQALYLLNDPFVRRQALSLAERVLKPKQATEAERIQQAYRLTLGRSASEKEVERVKKFVSEYEALAKKDYEAKAPVKPVQKPNEVKPRPMQPINPDDIDQTDEPITEESVRAPDAKTAAWASFCQALLGSAEFRFVK